MRGGADQGIERVARDAELPSLEHLHRVEVVGLVGRIAEEIRKELTDGPVKVDPHRSGQ